MISTKNISFRAFKNVDTRTVDCEAQIKLQSQLKIDESIFFKADDPKELGALVQDEIIARLDHVIYGDARREFLKIAYELYHQIAAEHPINYTAVSDAINKLMHFVNGRFRILPYEKRDQEKLCTCHLSGTQYCDLHANEHLSYPGSGESGSQRCALPMESDGTVHPPVV